MWSVLASGIAGLFPRAVFFYRPHKSELFCLVGLVFAGWKASCGLFVVNFFWTLVGGVYEKVGLGNWRCGSSVLFEQV